MPPIGDTGDSMATAWTAGLLVGQELEIAGKLGNDSHSYYDVDLISVELAAGQTIQADIDARRLDGGGSLISLDSYLRQFDGSGYALDSSDGQIQYPLAYYISGVPL